MSSLCLQTTERENHTTKDVGCTGRMKLVSGGSLSSNSSIHFSSFVTCDTLNSVRAAGVGNINGTCDIVAHLI